MVEKNGSLATEFERLVVTGVARGIFCWFEDGALNGCVTGLDVEAGEGWEAIITGSDGGPIEGTGLWSSAMRSSSSWIMRATCR